MAKNHNAPKPPPAPAPGAAAPEPVPQVPTAPEGAPSAEPLPAAPGDPEEGTDDLQSPDAQASGTPEEPVETNAPRLTGWPAPEAKTRFRVNWHFTGFRQEDLFEGDEVEATEDEAAPFLGGVLTRIEEEG